MELNEGQFNILLDILYYLRKNGKESSDFYFTYSNAGERLKLHNIASDDISLEFSNFKEIDFSQLQINSGNEEGLFGDVISKIDDFMGVDMSDIESEDIINRVDDKNFSKELHEKSDLYSKIKALTILFNGTNDFKGNNIDEAKTFKIKGELSDKFSDFGRDGDRKLKLKLTGFCNIESSTMGNEKFLIEGRFNANSRFAGELIVDDKSKEEEDYDKLVNRIFEDESKKPILFNIFKELRDKDEIKLRKGKIAKFYSNFDKDFKEMVSAKGLLEGLGDIKEEELEELIKEKFKKTIEELGEEKELFGKKIKYSKKEIKKNEERENKLKIMDLKISGECKKLMLSNVSESEIAELIKETEGGKPLEESKIKDVIRKKVFSICKFESIDDENKCIKGENEVKKLVKKIEAYKDDSEDLTKIYTKVLRLFKIIGFDY